MVNIQNGTIEDFFDSAMQTAKQIDNNEKVTSKHTIWMETNDLLNILKPQRTKLIQYLKNKNRVYYSVILDELKKSPSSLNKDLELLSKYQLIDILKEPNAGHGIRKIIKPLYSNEQIEFKATI
ncbi:MAG: transcriptional regulator [Epsilonproteobacteria bacterium]|nr:MAG: transcriptional regulator [Campylobacterota bacterium]